MVAYQKMPKSQPVRSWLFSKNVKNKDVKKIENDRLSERFYEIN
ncbi:hypothetical protein SAM19_03596 [Brevibacillus laterosporus]|nr:hypothetical protein [Brevibacillus laterosporus]